MKFIDLSIDEVLLLKNFVVNRPDESIDSLNRQAIAADSGGLKLALLSEAAKRAERFHSFFHFEQSYFHTQLAMLYTMNKEYERAKEQLNLAVFQDHANLQARQLLDFGKSEELYIRPYASFTEYISFAVNGKVKDLQDEGYWCMEHSTIEELGELIEKIRFHHLRYHEEAAKIYLNRAMSFEQLGQMELAKNDLVKAHNLDSKLEQKEYYCFNFPTHL